MKNLLVICCLIAAFYFSAIHAQTLCASLSPRAVGSDATEQTFVSLWVNASFALYAANPSFGSSFIAPSNETLSAHVSFYGTLIGCGAFAGFPPVANNNMTDVHSQLTIPAADFEAYVELTRQALQQVVPDATVGEVTQFYQIFESFHESNSTKTICNQPDCQTEEEVTVSTVVPVSFSDSYIPTSASSLMVDYAGTDAVELYFVSASAPDCASAALLQEIAASEPVQTLEFPFTESGLYYIFQKTSGGAECFTNETIFNTSVLILDFTMIVLPPVDTPVEAPVEPPVTNTTEPVGNTTAPVGNTTAPVEAPLTPPVTPPVEAPLTPPVTPPVDTPIQTPVAEVPVDVPVATVPISAPVSDGNITPTAANEFQAGGYIAGIVILVLIVIGLLIAVIIMGVRLRRNSTVVVA